MTGFRWLSALLLGLAVVAGAGWLLQRQSAAQLRDELALLRDDSHRLAHLRAENAKLLAAQPPAAELERLRSDHAAVMQLRSEIERLRRGIDERERRLAQPAPASTAAPDADKSRGPQVLAAANLKDAGTATPMAALETLLWAARSGNVDALSKMMLFDVRATAQVQAMFDALPAAERQNHGTPFRFIAAEMAKHLPAGDAAVTPAVEFSPLGGTAKLDAEFPGINGVGGTSHFEFKKINDHWSVWVPQRMVAPLVAAGRPPTK